MTGAIVELADHFGIDVPQTRAIHACAKLLGQLKTKHAAATS
jgi:ketopantoate reductase